MLRPHFEIIANHTWQTLRDATAFKISQGEETLTDNLLLYLLRRRLPRLHLIKTPKHMESMMGTDWEWWVGSRMRGFVRYAIQAKKLDFESHRYQKLRHEVHMPCGIESQHSILKKYATANKALPLYAFYNFLDLPDFAPYWNCPHPLNVEQIGITVTPLENVELALATRGHRSFEKLHSLIDTIPLRCLAICPNIHPNSHQRGARTLLIDKFKSVAKLYSADEIDLLLKSENSEIGEYPANLYSSEVGIYPRHIAVIETGD